MLDKPCLGHLNRGICFEDVQPREARNQTQTKLGLIAYSVFACLPQSRKGTSRTVRHNPSGLVFR